MKNFLNTRHLSKKQQTKLDIINAAIKVIAKSGREAASILEITKVAKVANGTFYYHFQNKEVLIDAVGEKILNEITDSYEIDWKSAKEDPAILFANATKTNLRNCSQDALWLAVIIDSFHAKSKVPANFKRLQ